MDIQAYFADNNTGKYHDLPMTFDTGAYMTSIDSYALLRAGYNIKSGNAAVINTVGHNGVPAREILLRGFKLEDVSGFRVLLGPVLVYAIDMSDTFTAGVLGVNVIREFESRIKFGNPTLIELKPEYDITETEKFENFNRYNSRFGLWTKNQVEK